MGYGKISFVSFSMKKNQGQAASLSPKRGWLGGDSSPKSRLFHELIASSTACMEDLPTSTFQGVPTKP